MQVIVNEKEEVESFSPRLLIGATTIPLEEVVRLIHSFSGLAIASHIDRDAFSIIGQLGFIPPNLALDALEISPRAPIQEAVKTYAYGYPLTCSSDAHYPDDIGKGYTTFLLEEASLAEIKKALKNEGGRKLVQADNQAS
jgi:PHP family Zn ribbon phosphoesterase